MPYGGHFEVLYRYRVHPAQARAFEHAYGPEGAWAKLFARYPGHRRTRLFRHNSMPGVYVSLDVWETKADWEAFHKAAEVEYRRLDAQFVMLKLEEKLLGFYEGNEEYQATPDSDT